VAPKVCERIFFTALSFSEGEIKMSKKQWTLLVAVASLATAGLSVRHFAQAQDAVAPPQEQGGGFGGRGRGGGRGGGFGGFAQIAVSGNAVYILRGNTLYRMNASSLAIEAKADLPAMAPPQQAAGFRGGNFRTGETNGGNQGAPAP